MVPVNKTYPRFMEWLKKGRPFTLARFNDGEMGVVAGIGKAIARGDQKITTDLKRCLSKALSYRDKGNYWIGGPCRVCYPRLRSAFDQRTENYPSTTPATIFCNGNRWTRFLRDSFAGLKGKNLTVFHGEDQRMDALMGLIQPKSYTLYPVPIQNSFNRLDWCRKAIDASGALPAVTLFTCGPVGRILAQEGCKKYPDTTWLDLGSVYDPLTRGVWHRCHTGQLTYCPECNR